MERLCGNCFQEIHSDICPHCGFNESKQREKYPLALHPGSVLDGRYIVGRVLGQGGFGISYMAKDVNREALVAIKEYLPTNFAGRVSGSSQVQVYSGDNTEYFEYGKQQFLSEAKTLAQFIGNENIVRIHSYFEENGTAYFTMEFINGIGLDKYMIKLGCRLSEEEATRLLLPIMTSLAKVHAKDIVHRDVSPDNILVDKNNVARLIDFGAARYSTGEKSESLDIIIKHGFAPVEQYSRHGRQGPYTDVYAVAATYYYAITGKAPPDALDRIEEDQLKLPSELGIKIKPAVETVLKKALSVSAADRYQRMEQFRDAMIAALEKTEVYSPRSAVSKEEMAPLVRPKKKKWKPIFAVAMLAVVISVAAAFMHVNSETNKAVEKAVVSDMPTPTEIIETPEPETIEPTATPPLIEEIFWDYAPDTGTLTISGYGPMEDYPFGTSTPWEQMKGDIKKVVIQDGVTYIGDNAFSHCDELETAVIAPTVTALGSYSFSHALKLISIELPDGIETIGEGCFQYCHKLQDIKFPESLKAIGDAAFRQCYGFEHVELPEGLLMLPRKLFEECVGIHTVYIPSTVISIDNHTFVYCIIKRIEYNGTKEKWEGMTSSTDAMNGMHGAEFYFLQDQN